MTKFFLILLSLLFSLLPLMAQEDILPLEIQEPSFLPVNNETEEMVNWMKDILDFPDSSWWSAFLKVDREKYLPVNRKSMAYQPGEILMSDMEMRLAPITLFKIFESLQLAENSKVLVAGYYGAYEAALLQAGAMDVHLIHRREGVLPESIFPYTIGEFPYTQMVSEAPFDLIFITRPLDTVPPELLNQLNESGVLITQLENRGSLTQWILVEKVGLSHRIELLNSEGER